VSGLQVSGLKVEAVQLIPTELTGKVTILGNAIDDEKKQMGKYTNEDCCGRHVM
jgi:hypothetical protein